MPLRDKEGNLVFKIAYYGPVSAGKKTIIKFLYGKEQPFSDNQYVYVLNHICFRIFSVDSHETSRKENQANLKTADAIIFIWDSQLNVWKQNILALKNLLRVYGDKLIPPALFDPPEVPIVVLANKRDLEDIVEISKLRQVLDTAKLNHCLIYETIAITGANVKRAFVYAARQAVLNRYKKLTGNLQELKEEAKKRSLDNNLADVDKKLERETKLEGDISIIDLIKEEYKEISSKNIIDMIETLEELLNIYIEKFEASKTGMNIFHIMQEASKYATKETNNVISYQKYQILLGTLISKLKTLIPLLKERLEKC